MTAATDLLRSAASAMRERAEKAYASPWRADADSVWTAAHDDLPTISVDGGVYRHMDDTAEHIASWSPEVALTVADLLDRWADEIESTGATAAIDDAVVRVAAAYMSGRTA